MLRSLLTRYLINLSIRGQHCRPREGNTEDILLVLLPDLMHTTVQYLAPFVHEHNVVAYLLYLLHPVRGEDPCGPPV